MQLPEPSTSPFGLTQCWNVSDTKSAGSGNIGVQSHRCLNCFSQGAGRYLRGALLHRVLWQRLMTFVVYGLLHRSVRVIEDGGIVASEDFALAMFVARLQGGFRLGFLEELF